MDNSNIPEQIDLWERGMDAVYLMSCALHDRTPDLSVIGNLEQVFQYCRQHSITAMVAMALETAWKINPPEDPGVAAPWKQAKDKAIRKNILLNAERTRILAYLESIGCWYLPLKGSFLQHDYPKFGMRQMSDNDILYDTDMDQQIRDFMVSGGYTVKAFGMNNHDEYLKAPVYNFELHRRLFSPVSHKELASYYDTIRERMVKDSDNQWGYHLTHEDFYVYMIAHSHKHFVFNGTGIRTLVDGYVFLHRYPELDMDYVQQELAKMGLVEYEGQCRALAEKLLGDPRRDMVLTDEEGEFLSRFLGAGTYGNRKQRVENILERMRDEEKSGGLLVKLRYFWRRMFPPLEFMAVLEPELLEKPWKLPFAHARRLILAVFKKPKRVINEFLYLLQAKKKEQ